ncbi:MAG: hypothetical protein FWB96_11525 [Defluviitaleaceae bacterium]|nr:hypothetical protein [Defluviitaleaceae bacterium]MCL2263712.1 hypothetical protein [Defluviitaleaceae bacterium]
MLRPIDMTLTIQNSAEAHRAGAAGTEALRPEVASQMFADRLEKQARMQEQTVNKSAESEKGDVNPDRDGSGKGYNSNRKSSKKPGEKPKAKKLKLTESLYDIKI